MNIVDSMTLYSKYLKIQASKLDLETAGEKAEEICERLQELSHYCKATDKWCDAVEYAICETIEYINLCVYLCRHFGDGRSLIIPDVIGVVAELCDLKHSIAGIDDLDDRRGELLDEVGEAICDAGNSIRVQDEQYWLCISKLFDLDPDGTIKASLEADIALIAAGEEIEEEDDEPQPRKEMTIEEEALRVLKEAMNLPNGLISTSWVQRRFGYGYGKSAGLLDWLEDQRYVQSYADMKAEGLHGRRIYASKEMFENK